MIIITDIAEQNKDAKNEFFFIPTIINPFAYQINMSDWFLLETVETQSI